MQRQDGRAQRPSVIIAGSGGCSRESALKAASLRDIPGSTAEMSVSAPIPTFNELVSAMRQKHEGRYVDPLWESVAEWYKGRMIGRKSTYGWQKA